MPGAIHRDNRTPRHFDTRTLQFIDDAGAQFWSLHLSKRNSLISRLVLIAVSSLTVMQASR
jgi:hypothetical protein